MGARGHVTPKEGTKETGKTAILRTTKGVLMAETNDSIANPPQDATPQAHDAATAETDAAQPTGGAANEAERVPAPATSEDAEEALARVFADVRTQSADSSLVTPDRWETEHLAPAGMEPAAFAQLVFDVIDANAAQAAAAHDEEPASHAAAEADAAAAFGGTVEGAAPADDSASPADGAGADATEAAEPDSASSDDAAQTIPDQVLAALAASTFAVPTADIAVLQGTKARYLYSTDFMTDSFAHWTYLALEDDKVATFVDIVREESRTYPRPMVYRALLNDPFRMTEDQVLDCWKTVRESEKFPDIASCDASNGDVYFYSSDYLSEAQAKALAEYYSVERWMNP